MGAVIGTMGGWVLIFLICGGLWGCPQYEVYSERMSGEAQLAKANSNREIAVREAQAKLDAASKLADAEIARARGVAGANKIIGDSLAGNEAYLRYLWIDKLDGSKQTTVYVPTEAGMPILEAGRSVPK